MCYEVVCMCLIKNGVLVRCEVYFGRSKEVGMLDCGVVGFILFVPIGILFLCNRVIRIFFDVHD